MLDSTVQAETVADILIIGAGFAGIAMAIKLREAGFNDVMLIEKAAEIGGTWRENTYPGCACDVPSHLYSLSFEPKSDWSRMYAPQPEIQAYLRNVAEKHDLRSLTRFNTEMTAAMWDDAAASWRVRTTTGAMTARVLISAVGGLHIPALPKIPGLETFAGKVFHSAQWDHGYDLAGKRVAVIGTGASAIQFIPRIAPVVDQLDVYQRTPPWVIPKPDRPFSVAERAALRFGPARRAFRRYLFLTHEARVLSFLGNRRALQLGTRLARRHLETSVADPTLRAKLTPNYQIGCKRIMLSNDYYPALQRPNVDLITAGVAAIRPHAIIDANGTERAADAIICGTGFAVTTAYKHTAITGRAGQDLGALWDRTGMQAYNGIAVAGFPNYFMLVGPHTGVGHNSIIYMIEAQAGYITGALKKLRALGLAALEVDRAVQDDFIAGIKTRLRGTVWQDGGCNSWYKDEHGNVTAIWPGSASAYSRTVKTAHLRDYHLFARQGAAVTV